uniref:RNase_PH_C domain-containing protein n=1 Tax=Macrostomum lignano TaxID=282301 RepID=A0A1I8FAN8_9PLAT
LPAQLLSEPERQYIFDSVQDAVSNRWPAMPGLSAGRAQTRPAMLRHRLSPAAQQQQPVQPSVSANDGDLLDAASIAASAALMRALPASLLSARRCLCFATVHRIGSQQIVDANQLEESCSMARVTVGVDSNGRRWWPARLAAKGSLQFESMTEMIETGVRKAYDVARFGC